MLVSYSIWTELKRTQIGIYGLTNNDLNFLLTLCSTEVSTLDYSVSHQSKYTHICGVDPLWKPYLAERGIKYNSLQAAWAVFNYYYVESDYDIYKAILGFKGVQRNKEVKQIAKRIISTTNKLKESK